MKKLLIISTIMLIGFAVFGQVKVDVKDKLDREANYRANSNTDKIIDKGFDKLEDGIGNLFKKKDKKKKIEENKDENKKGEPKESSDSNVNDDTKNVNETEESPVNVVWSKFDFVPGDEVIFEDAPSTNEENGEFPSRWDLYKGAAEIGEMNGETVIMFLDGGGTIIPYLKNSKEDYLPEVFTLEFDAYFEKGNKFHRYWISFNDMKNQAYKGIKEDLTVYANGIEFGNTDKRYPGTERLNWSNNPKGQWRHISIAYTKGKFKAYMDDTRLINVPHLEGELWGITIKAENDQMFIKNIRMAKGGVKYYDRVQTDGKIIVNGIRFDIGKATLKPESMGPINKIYSLMAKNTDINFSVEGHTDSDGNETTNQKLSEERAKAVMNKLIAMGIAKNRLKSAGFGESKPLDNNSSPEGKANNRRVEFVKF